MMPSSRCMRTALGSYVLSRPWKNRDRFNCTPLHQAIVAMDMDLSETFKMFDKDGDGTVDIKEAKQAGAATQRLEYHGIDVTRPLLGSRKV